MLSIKQILKKTSRNELTTVKGVRLRKVEKQGNAYIGVTQTLNPANPPGKTPKFRRHICKVYPADKKYRGKISECTGVKLTCTCERWKFFWETALFLKGAADLIHSNGDLPLATNPTLRPSACKHGVLLLLHCLDKKL